MSHTRPEFLYTHFVTHTSRKEKNRALVVSFSTYAGQIQENFFVEFFFPKERFSKNEKNR